MNYQGLSSPRLEGIPRELLTDILLRLSDDDFVSVCRSPKSRYISSVCRDVTPEFQRRRIEKRIIDQLDHLFDGRAPRDLLLRLSRASESLIDQEGRFDWILDQPELEPYLSISWGDAVQHLAIDYDLSAAEAVGVLNRYYRGDRTVRAIVKAENDLNKMTQQ